MRKREAFKVRFQVSSDQLILWEGRGTLGRVVRGERHPASPEQVCGGEGKEAGWGATAGI